MGVASYADIQRTLGELEGMMVEVAGGADQFGKAVTDTTVNWFDVVREDLEDLMYVAAPKDAPLSTRFDRIQGEGTSNQCPNRRRRLAA